MQVEAITARLFDAASVRMPSLDRDGSLGFQIEQMQDHLLATAQIRCDLEEARLYAHAALKKLQDEWEDIEGWELHLDGRPSLAAKERAKALVRPDLRDSIREARWLVDRLSDQITRLEVDDRAASRVYTMLVGG